MIVLESVQAPTVGARIRVQPLTLKGKNRVGRAKTNTFTVEALKDKVAFSEDKHWMLVTANGEFFWVNLEADINFIWETVGE